MLRLDGDARLWWKPHQQAEVEHPYDNGRDDTFGGGACDAASVLAMGARFALRRCHRWYTYGASSRHAGRAPARGTTGLMAGNVSKPAYFCYAKRRSPT